MGTWTRGSFDASHYARVVAATERLQRDIAEIVHREVLAAVAAGTQTPSRTSDATPTPSSSHGCRTEPLLTTAEIAMRLGLDRAQAGGWLAARGVTPLTRGGGAPLYRWRDVATAMDRTSPDPWVRRDLVGRATQAEPVDLDTVRAHERCRRPLASMKPRRAYALVAMLVNENTLQEIGEELGVTRERARQIAIHAIRDFESAFRMAGRPEAPPSTPPAVPTVRPIRNPRRVVALAPLLVLDPFVAGVPLDEILMTPPTRVGTVFAWDPWPWTPSSPALVMHPANRNAARGLYPIGNHSTVYAAAQSNMPTGDAPVWAANNALERVSRVNAVFGSTSHAADLHVRASVGAPASG